MRQSLKFAFTFGILSILTCCSSAPKVPEKIPIVSIESDPVARRLASATNSDALEKSYQEMLNSKSPGLAMAEHARRMTRIFYVAEGFLRDYDKKLDEWASQKTQSENAMIFDETYAKLMAAWILREETLAKINYFYVRNLEVMDNRADDSPQARQRQDNALLANSALLKATVQARKETDVIALHTLLDELLSVAREYHESSRLLGKNQSERSEELYARILSRGPMQNTEAISRFYSAKGGSLAIEVKRAKSDVELQTEVSQLVPAVSTHLRQHFEPRTPQSLKSIVPSPNSDGTVTGNTFRQGRWALTFDDGPSNQYTPMVLDNLQAHNLKATFFWLAVNIPKNPAVIARAKSMGMVLGNHSFTHPQLPTLSAEGLHHEIVDSTDVDIKYFGFKPKFFRCPYGACGGSGSQIRQMIADLGMVHVFWNVDSLDWQDKNSATVYQRVKKQMAAIKRGIILFHDIHPQSVEASRRIMDDLVQSQKLGEARVLTIEQAVDELDSAEGMK